MESRNTRILFLSGVSCLLLLAVLFFANALLARASVRVDLTEEGLYTLSDGSKKILGDLEDPARIKVFWHNVPLRFDNTKRYVAALLEEMENASDGKVQAQWVDMSEDAGLEQASEIGLEEHRFAVRHGSEFRQATGYMSLVIEIGDSEPVKINELANIQDKLEYRVVSSIFKGQRLAPPIIALVQRQPPFNPMMGGRQGTRFAFLERELRFVFGDALRSYVQLDEPVPEDVDVVILADPRDLEPKQVYHFEQFLLRGGRALVLFDPLDAQGVVSPQVQVVRAASSGMEDWLAHLGLTVEKGCVVDFDADASCLYPFENRDMMGRTLGIDWRRYNHWPKLLPENTDATNPVMRYLSPMALYWPAAISVDTAKQEAAGRTAKVLATSSAQGHRRSDVTNLRQAGFSPDGKLLEKVPLIVLVEGPLTSFWTDKPIPGTEAAEPRVGDDQDEDAKDGDAKGAKDEDAKGDKDAKDEDAKGAKGEDPKEEGVGDPDGDAPKSEEPKSDEPNSDDPKGDAPKSDGPKEAPGDPDGEPPVDEPEGEEPKADEPADEEPKADEPADEEDGPPAPESIEQGTIRLVVIGDADMVANTFSPQTFLTQINGATGFAFVPNMAEWLSGSEELMALRSRATNPRNLEQLEEGERDLLKHLNLLLVPLLVLLAGMTVFIVRRS